MFGSSESEAPPSSSIRQADLSDWLPGMIADVRLIWAEQSYVHARTFCRTKAIRVTVLVYTVVCISIHCTKSRNGMEHLESSQSSSSSTVSTLIQTSPGQQRQPTVSRDDARTWHRCREGRPCFVYVCVCTYRASVDNNYETNIHTYIRIRTQRRANTKRSNMSAYYHSAWYEHRAWLFGWLRTSPQVRHFVELVASAAWIIWLLNALEFIIQRMRMQILDWS